MRSILGILDGILNGARTAINVVVTGTSRTILRVSINTAVLGVNTIIAAPAAGAIHITHLSIQNPATGANTIILLDNVTAINGTGYLLNASGGGYTFDAADAGTGEIILTALAPFIINLSAGTQINGTVVYWVG